MDEKCRAKPGIFLVWGKRVSGDRERIAADKITTQRGHSRILDG
jgi:hypothetical protein